MFTWILPNVLAVLTSIIAIVLLSRVVVSLEGTIKAMLKSLLFGIFFAVFVHGSFELASVFGLVDEMILMRIMGVLLTVGSLFFIRAAYLGLKIHK